MNTQHTKHVPDPCHGADEQNDRHQSVCVPFYAWLEQHAEGLDRGLGREAATDERPTLGEYADHAFEAVRAINHATVTRPPLLAPVVYEILGNLKQLGYALDQALGQISVGLGASLEAPGLYEVYEADGSDPAVSVEAARAALGIACGAADDLAASLEYAQGQLTWQGYRPVTTTATASTAGGDR